MFVQKVRGAIQRFGPQFVKRRLWNREYSTGHWEHLRKSPGDPIYAVLGRFARNKTMLDIGCGMGTTIAELPDHFCDAYCGVDISDVAIKEARSRVRDRSEAIFLEGDMLTFEPPRLFDVILFRDIIYYNSVAGALHTLTRYARYLAPDGVFVVRMFKGNSAEVIRESIATHFQVIEETEYEEPHSVISVFRSH